MAMTGRALVAAVVVMMSAGCKSGTYVLVGVESGTPLTATSLDVTITIGNGGQVGHVKIEKGGTPFTLPQSFSLAVDDQHRGTATIEVVAKSGTGELARASVTANIVSGGTTSVMLQLMPAAMDMGTSDVTPHPDAGATLSFSVMKYAADQRPIAIALSDFNGDGEVDIAVSNGNSKNVSLLSGTGGGVFGAAVNYPIPTDPRYIAAGEINGDGHPDLVLIGGNNVGVLLGVGNGMFQPPVFYAAKMDALFLALGDFNRDGRTDVAAANHDSNDVSILINNGAMAPGTLRDAVTLSINANGPRSMATGDFNGDGSLDLVTANDTSHNVSILLGNGDGTFQSATTTAMGMNMLSVFVAVGDFNADKKADLAVGNGADESVAILLGKGDGSFRPAMNYRPGALPASIAIGDFDGNGTSDLAVALDDKDGTVSLFSGNGDGTFKDPIRFTAGGIPWFIAAADLNGDGKPDIVVPTDSTNTVTVLLNTSH